MNWRDMNALIDFDIQAAEARDAMIFAGKAYAKRISELLEGKGFPGYDIRDTIACKLNIVRGIAMDEGLRDIKIFNHFNEMHALASNYAPTRCQLITDISAYCSKLWDSLSKSGFSEHDIREFIRSETNAVSILGRNEVFNSHDK